MNTGISWSSASTESLSNILPPFLNSLDHWWVPSWSLRRKVAWQVWRQSSSSGKLWRSILNTDKPFWIPFTTFLTRLRITSSSELQFGSLASTLWTKVKLNKLSKALKQMLVLYQSIQIKKKKNKRQKKQLRLKSQRVQRLSLKLSFYLTDHMAQKQL